MVIRAENVLIGLTKKQTNKQTNKGKRIEYCVTCFSMLVYFLFLCCCCYSLFVFCKGNPRRKRRNCAIFLSAGVGWLFCGHLYKRNTFIIIIFLKSALLFSEGHHAGWLFPREEQIKAGSSYLTVLQHMPASFMTSQTLFK